MPPGIEVALNSVAFKRHLLKEPQMADSLPGTEQLSLGEGAGGRLHDRGCEERDR